MEEPIKSSICDFHPTPFGFQAPYYIGGGGVGPFPVSSRGRYEHYHAIFDQMQQQKENVFRIAEEREAKLRAKLQDRGAVERYGYLPYRSYMCSALDESNESYCTYLSTEEFHLEHVQEFLRDLQVITIYPMLVQLGKK